MFLSILHRYVFMELLRVFLLALFALTGILTLVLLVAEAAQQGLAPAQILRLVPLLIPSTLPITIPTTTLFAVAVVYGRLAHDQELTAIKAAGVQITHMLWPALVLGSLLSVGVFFLYEEVIPRSTNRFKNEAMRDIEELFYARLRRDLQFAQPGLDYAIYVKEVQGRRLIQATFKKRGKNGADEIVAQAREAEISVNLERGEVKVTMRHGNVTREDGVTGVIEDEESFVVALPADQKNRQARPRELTNSQILARLQETEVDLQRSAAAIVQHFGEFKHTPELAEKNPVNVHHQLTLRRKWELETEYASRPAVAAGCFFFVLIGCPVAIWFHRRDYLSAFVTCFLPIIVTYYPMIMFGINLGKEGRLDPTWTLWAGDGVLGLVGLVLTYRLMKH